MKKWKSLLQNRRIQMLALLGALGASLSWNPAYLSMARHEFVKSSEFQLASEDSIRMDLGKNVGLKQDNAGAVYYQVSPGKQSTKQPTEIVFNYYTKDGEVAISRGGILKIE
ncbi:MAG: hypothetical protein WCH11_07960, partial [Bdellovibrio sp.]